MGKFQAFAEVLEGKIRQELVEEMTFGFEKPKSSNENKESDYRYLGYLLGNTDTFKGKAQAQPQVKAFFKAHYRPPPPPKPHVMNAHQLGSYMFFKGFGCELSVSFTKAELKKAFRRLVMKFHPDRGGTAQQFRELVAHHQSLQTVLKSE